MWTGPSHCHRPKEMTNKIITDKPSRLRVDLRWRLMHHVPLRSWSKWFVGLCASLTLIPLQAATPLHTSDFEDGTVQGWQGDERPNPLAQMIVDTGGPDGDGDAFLMLRSSGDFVAHETVATYNIGNDWIGDYASAGVTSIEVDMMNPVDSTPLNMRLMLFGSDRWTSTVGHSVPDDGVWRHYSFPITGVDMTQVKLPGFPDELFGDMVSNVSRVILRHDSGGPSRGESPIQATMGLDNITLVPEPSATVLLILDETYTQSFDSLGTDATATSQLPPAWTVTDDIGFALFRRETNTEFPATSRIRGAEPFVLNAGELEAEDRSLAIYRPVRNPVGATIQFLADTPAANANALQLDFAIEAWDQVREISSNTPGAAAFDVLVDIDTGDGFSELMNLGNISTGEVLPAPEGDYLNGNDEANRVVFNNVILAADIPADSRLRFRWKSSQERDASGEWVFGIDDVGITLSFLGDFDDDGLLGIADIDRLSEEVRDRATDTMFDLNGDGRVAAADRDLWLDLSGVLPGDTDFNNSVEFGDFLKLSENFGQRGGWAKGDFDGDGEVAFADFLALSANFGESTPQAAAVPEPLGFGLAVFGLLGALGFRRRSD